MSALSAAPLGAPAPQEAPKRRLRIVPGLPRTAPRVPFLALMSLVMLLGVVGLLMFNTSMQQAAFTVSTLEEQNEILAAREQQLAMELDQLSDPQAIAEEARALGMVPVVNPAFLQLPDGTIIGDPRAAKVTDWQRIDPLPVRKPEVLTPDPQVAPDTDEDRPARQKPRGGNR